VWVSFWDGAASTLFWVDPVNKLTAVLFVQVFPFSNELHKNFRDAVYGRPVVIRIEPLSRRGAKGEQRFERHPSRSTASRTSRSRSQRRMRLNLIPSITARWVVRNGSSIIDFGKSMPHTDH